MTEGTALADRVATRLEDRAADVARQWLDDLAARLDQPRRRVFPDDTLLQHVPELLRAVGSALRTEQSLDAEAHEMMVRLARLRRWQGYAREDIEQELELLGERVFEVFRDEVAENVEIDAAQVVDVSQRLHRTLVELERSGAGAVEDEARSNRRLHSSSLHLLARAVTHELNNRLLAARFSLEHARMSTTGADAEAALDTLGQTLTALEQVTGDVFTVALTQSREAPALGRWQPLRDLIRELIRDVRGYAGQRRVEVHCDLDAVPDWWVDASRVQLVLANLVINAVKYSDPDEPERWVRIAVDPDPDAGGWIIAVADNGLGIPEPARRRIFDPDYRIERGNQPGAGLGLAVAREAADQVGGRLTVESSEGRGSIFRLHLPAAPTTLGERG